MGGFSRVDKLKYPAMILINCNEIAKETQKRLHSGNMFYFAIKLLSSQLLSKLIKIRIDKAYFYQTSCMFVRCGCLVDERKYRVFENKIFGPATDIVVNKTQLEVLQLWAVYFILIYVAKSGCS